MTVNTTNITSGPYVGTGLATEYSYDFRIQDVSQLLVYETDTSGVRTLLTQGTDYTVSGVGDDNGGLVTRLAGALPTGYIWYIRSNYPQTQLTAFRSQGGFSPAVHEDEFDKTTFLVQQLQDQADRAFRLNSELDIDGTFTLDKDKTDRATTVLGFDANGNLVVLDQNTVSTVPAILVQSATLTAGQTSVTFTSPVENSSMYISGPLVDNGRLVEGVDYTQNITTNVVTLTESYPAGTLLSLVYNDIGSTGATGFRQDFNTVAQLKASSLSTGLTVTTQGYYAAGDGGHAEYLIVSAATYGGTPDEYGDHTLANGNVAVLQIKDVINVKQFGASPSASAATNDTAISNAITYLKSIGGGTLEFGQGIYEVSTTVVVDDNDIFLKGQGKGDYGSDSKTYIRASAATTLKWAGATGSGTVVKFTSDAADAGTEVKKVGGGISGIFIDCQEKAAVGLEVQTWSNGKFDVLVGWAYTYGYKIWVLSNGVATGVADTQLNTFELHYTEVNSAQNPTAVIVGGNSTANTSLNKFFITAITDGTGASLECEETDSNVFNLARCVRRTGTGGHVVLHADDTGALGDRQLCRGNQFYFTNFKNGITAKATVAGSLNSRNNIIYGLSRENGGTDPTVESGAHMIIADEHPSSIYSGQPGLYRYLTVNSQVKALYRWRKSADETVNNSTTLQDDDELKFNMAVNQRYAFKFHLLVTGDATANIKCNLTVPSGASFRWGPENSIKIDATGTIAIQRTYNSSTAMPFYTNGTDVHYITLVGEVVCGATPGYLQLQWAQNTAVSADTKVLASSSIEVTMI